MSDTHDRLQSVAESVGTRYSAWYGIGALDVKEVLVRAAELGLVTLNFDYGGAKPMRTAMKSHHSSFA